MSSNSLKPFLILLVLLQVIVVALSSNSLKCQRHSKLLQDTGLLHRTPIYPHTDGQLSTCRSKHSCCDYHTEKALRTLSVKRYGEAVSRQLEPFTSATVNVHDAFKVYRKESSDDLEKLLRNFFDDLYPSPPGEGRRGEVNDILEPLMTSCRLHSGENINRADFRRTSSSNIGPHQTAKEFLSSLFEMYLKRGLLARDVPGHVLDCAKANLPRIQPFGANGHRIYSVIVGALTHIAGVDRAASTCAHLGRQVGHWPENSVSRSCGDALTRLTGGCAACERTSPAKPCRSAVLNAARGCLVQRLSPLHAPLDTFVKHLGAMLKKVKGQPRFDDLHAQLTLNIRMALQHAQDNAKIIFEQVVEICQSKSSDYEQWMKMSPRSYTYRRKAANHVTGSKPKRKSLHRLGEAVKVLDTRKRYLKLLPNRMTKLQQTKEEHCWDGYRVVRSYNKIIAKATLKDQLLRNPEVKVTTKNHFTRIIAQMNLVSKSQESTSEKRKHRRRSVTDQEGTTDAESSGEDDEDGEGSTGSGSGSEEKQEVTPAVPSTTDGFSFEPKYTTVKNVEKEEGSSAVRHSHDYFLLAVLTFLTLWWNTR